MIFGSGSGVSVRALKALVGLALQASLAGGIAGAAATVDAHAATGNDAVTIVVGGSPLSEITSDPLSLTPAFAPTVVDYVWRCQLGDNNVHLTLSAISGGTITAEGNTGPTVEVQESLLENEALIIQAQDPSRPDGAPVQYWIRCLPHDFPQLRVTRLGSPPAGWYLTGNIASADGSGGYAMVLDNNGIPVWYRKPVTSGAINVTLLSDGSIAWASNGGGAVGTNPDAAFEDFNLETATTTWLKAPVVPTDFHELHELPNGHFMMLGTPLKSGVDLTALGFSSSATIIDCVVQDVAPSGQLVWEWRASDHISVRESTHPTNVQVNGQSVYDIYHCNSIDTDPVSGNVLVSSRQTDAVYLIDRTSGKIIWKLGGNSPNNDNAQILTITNDPDGAFHAQHDARFEPDGGISVYDDQTWDVDLAARGVQYQVNIEAGTANLVWSFASPDGHDAAATGSFRRLDGGNDNIIGWGVKADSLFTEVDSAGNMMLNVTFPNGEQAYRVQKVAPGAIDVQLLRATAGLPPAPPPPLPPTETRLRVESALALLTIAGALLVGVAWLRRRRKAVLRRL